MLADHVRKGDPVDVGNFAMMLFNRGEATTVAPDLAGELAKFDSINFRDVFGDAPNHRERKLMWDAWQAALASRPQVSAPKGKP
jgi:hypothetical protein